MTSHIQPANLSPLHKGDTQRSSNQPKVAELGFEPKSLGEQGLGSEPEGLGLILDNS